MSLRNYTDLSSIPTLEERFAYLALRGRVGEPTFGYERWLNQQFYSSREWRQVRSYVIDRDEGCDLGVPGYEIHTRLHIHHMNPMEVDQLLQGDESVLDPEFLITTSHQTHNAIHYGDERQLPRLLTERSPGDTKLW